MVGLGFGKTAGMCLAVLGLAGCDAGAKSGLSDDEPSESAGTSSGGSSGTGNATSGGGGAGNSASGGSGSGASGGAGPTLPGGACQRPAGKAAVTLTYDDALPSHLAIAAPALAAHGLKATFFVTDVRAAPADWAALKAAGHELGSHTFKHPCPKVNTWVAAGDANEDYDLARMTTELDETVTMLEELGQTAPLTFAYPCGIDWVGEAHDSYAPLIQERFSAARGVVPGLVKAGVALSNVPATFSMGDAAQLIAIADGAKAGGSWVVFGFHGVGGDHSAVTAEAHEALLAHLADHADEFHVGTFGELAACLAP